MFVSTHVALAWEASRTSFDTSSDLVWMHKHGCSSQRRRRICLIALNAWSLSSLLYGEVCIDGPLFCNTDTESWITHAWGVFVHIENTSVTLHNQTSSNWKAIKTVMFLPFSSRHHQGTLSADRRRPLRVFSTLLSSLTQLHFHLRLRTYSAPHKSSRDWMLAEVQVGSSTNLSWDGIFLLASNSDLKHHPDWKSITILKT